MLIDETYIAECKENFTVNPVGQSIQLVQEHIVYWRYNTLFYDC